jgi:hypothetical protein
VNREKKWFRAIGSRQVRYVVSPSPCGARAVSLVAGVQSLEYLSDDQLIEVLSGIVSCTRWTEVVTT